MVRGRRLSDYVDIRFSADVLLRLMSHVNGMLLVGISRAVAASIKSDNWKERALCGDANWRRRTTSSAWMAMVKGSSS